MLLPVCGGSRRYQTMLAWMVWRIKPKRRTYAASSKMILRVWRSPERIRLTPCRMRTRYLLRVPCTGRSSTENITALPRVRCTTSAHDCMRGRCSVKINLPPVKSVLVGGAKAPRLGAERPIRHTGRGEDNCSRRGRIAVATGSGGFARRHDSVS